MPNRHDKTCHSLITRETQCFMHLIQTNENKLHINSERQLVETELIKTQNLKLLHILSSVISPLELQPNEIHMDGDKDLAKIFTATMIGTYVNIVLRRSIFRFPKIWGLLSQKEIHDIVFVKRKTIKHHYSIVQGVFFVCLFFINGNIYRQRKHRKMSIRMFQCLLRNVWEMQVNVLFCSSQSSTSSSEHVLLLYFYFF